MVVLRVDKDKERVSLGYRQRFEDPWTHVEARYPVGKKIAGKVTNVVDYGAFVELEEGVEGLIHVSEMSWTKKVKNPKAVLKSAQEVEVVITEVDIDKRRLSLSLRQAEPNPWEEFATRFRVGAEGQGRGAQPHRLRRLRRARAWRRRAGPHLRHGVDASHLPPVGGGDRRGRRSRR